MFRKSIDANGLAGATKYRNRFITEGRPKAALDAANVERLLPIVTSLPTRPDHHWSPKVARNGEKFERTDASK